MDHTCDYRQMLNMIPTPAFTVQNGKVVFCNRQASQLFLEPGMAVDPHLTADAREAYTIFRSGSLYLDMSVQGTTWGATITKLSDGDLFCLEQTGVTPELKAMSLLSAQLRAPLSTLTITATKSTDKPSGEMLRELDRINRILTNVSNAHRFALDDGSYQQERSICSVMDELLQECRDLLAQANINLVYTLPARDIFTALDWQMLRHAVYNLLSNAAQHTEPGGQIKVTLGHRGRQLLLTVTDYGSGICNEAHGSLFSRYTRQPGIEDGLNGVGLGMTIIRTAATAHGGTVLVEEPEEGGTRVTMTLAIRGTMTMLRTPMTTIAPSRDDGKVMLSDILPASLYEPK